MLIYREKCVVWALALLAVVFGSTTAGGIVSVPMKRVENGLVATVGIGTPAQTMDLLVDTSSTTLWAYSQQCSSLSIACWNHKRFDGSKSKTYKTQHRQVQLPDESTGIASSENFTLGSMHLDLPFVDLIKRSGVWAGESEYYDGVFGVGLPYDYAVRDLPPPPHFKILADAREKTFAFYFGKDKSSLDFGGIDHSLVKAETMAFTNVIIDDCWTIKIDRIMIGNKVVCDNGCEARLDTASDGIMGPDSQIRAIRETTRHSETDGYFSCSKLSQLPPLKFVIGGKVFALEASDYAIKHNYVFGLCSDGLTDLGNQEHYWILGNNFITKFYTVFDLANKRVGFGKHRKN